MSGKRNVYSNTRGAVKAGRDTVRIVKNVEYLASF